MTYVIREGPKGCRQHAVVGRCVAAEDGVAERGAGCQDELERGNAGGKDRGRRPQRSGSK